jgi:hypothetical protein
MRVLRLSPLLLALLLASACPGDDTISCDTNADCLQGGIPGVCMPSTKAGSDTMWCGFPDGSCSSGYRWGVKSGDGLASECVADEPVPDAGVDGSIDASDDTTPPTLVSTLPANNAADESTSTIVTATFSEPIAAASVDATSFTVTAAGGAAVSGALAIDGAIVTFTPSARLSPDVTYTVAVSTKIADLAGNHLAGAASWVFTTHTAGWTTRELLETEMNKAAHDLDVSFKGSKATALWLMSAANGNTIDLKSEVWTSSYSAGAWSAPFRIVTVPAVIGAPRVATDATGRATAVWLQKGASFLSVVASRYEPATGWSAPTTIETEEAGDAAFPAVTMDPNGNALVVWSQGDGSTSNAWANRFAVGMGWGTATKLETSTVSVSGRAAVDAAADGSALALWSQGTSLLASRFSGTSWASPVTVGASTGSAFVQVRFAADGTAVAAWTDGRVHAAQFAGTWSAPDTLDASPAGSVIAGVSLALATDGKALVVWHQGSGAQHTWQALLDGAGTWGSSFRIDASTAATFDARVAFDASGTAVAVWSEDGTATDVPRSIRAGQFRPITGWTAPQLVETDDTVNANASKPAVGYDAGANTFVAVWLQAGIGFDSVYASRFE